MAVNGLASSSAAVAMKGEEASVSFSWLQPGSYFVTMTPVRDSHDRQFKPERATRYSVTVQ